MFVCVMVEIYVLGCELMIVVLGDWVFGVIEIVILGWYDYDVKYKFGGLCYVIFVEIFVEIDVVCCDYVVCVYVVLGCSGLLCIDFCWDDSCGLDGLILLEVNI